MKISLILVAKMVINDFLRGKIPWYIPDPTWPERKAKETEEGEFAGSEGRLGEMRLKVGQTPAKVEDTDSWDGLDIESDDEKEIENDESRMRSDEEDVEERIEDPRPSKKIRR